MEKQSYQKYTPKELLEKRAKDKLFNFILEKGSIRGAIVQSTLMVNEMRDNFELGILESYILGQSYTAAALLSSQVKGNDRLTLKISCDGPVGGIVVDSNSYGEIRGYLKNQSIPVNGVLENLDISEYLGSGYISIIKYLENAKQPYEGQVPLKYRSIAEDLANYFNESEQTPSAFQLSIHYDRAGDITGAGGIFLQALPGASESSIENLENTLLKMESPGKLFSQGFGADELVLKEFAEYGPKILESKRVEFFCRCSEKQMLTYLTMLPPDDRKDIKENGPFPLEIRCHSCNTRYSISRDKLQANL
ncbi:MAG: Hsp33 family molecular chaperone HslO [Deltaproteobacteria bacterium]|nr:Hsp33 family molecular chaperone HslO [Deltaproteobacteria bacterium]